MFVCLCVCVCAQIDGGDRHSRAQTPQIRVTAPEAETTEAKNVQLPVPGMKYKLLIHLISGTDLAIRDKSGEFYCVC